MEIIPYTNHSLKGKVDFMYRDGISCDYHRIILPALGLGIDPAEGVKKSELDVFCRMSGLRDSKVPLIVDVDDYWYLYPHHYLYGNWNGNKHTETIIEALKSATAVTVTNRKLFDRANQFNKNVYVIPNGLPFDQGQFTLGDTSGPVRFIWAGGASHLHDLNVIRPVFSSLAFDFTIFGDDGYGEWTKIKNLFAGKAKVIKSLPVDRYMDGMKGNVMLIPIENNYFNNHKSNLKLLEAGCKGMAVIASKCEPYYNSCDEPYVMYASNPTEWALHMKYCVANPNFVADMGSMLAEHVRRKYPLEWMNRQRVHIYEKVIKNA